MILNFYSSRLSKESHMYEELCNNKSNEFIVVGEEKSFYYVHQVENGESIRVSKDANILDSAIFVEKEHIDIDDRVMLAIDIPKEYISDKSVKAIIKLNS